MNKLIIAGICSTLLWASSPIMAKEALHCSNCTQAQKDAKASCYVSCPDSTGMRKMFEFTCDIGTSGQKCGNVYKW